MYARSTTIRGKPENIDDGLRFVETEVRPLIETIDGCRGMSVLVNRDTGECIATSSWDSQESMRASDDQLRPKRDRGSEVFEGDLQVDEWEIALMHRDHATADGACSRVTWAQGDAAKADESIQQIRDSVPRIEQIDGFCSISVLLDRESGKWCVTTTYDSREALDASRAMADQIRAAIADAAAMKVLEVKEYDLAMAHLHVPELV